MQTENRIHEKLEKHTPDLQMLQMKFKLAVGFHHKGALAEARKLYEEILAVEPVHLVSLHLLGLCLLELGQTREAEELLSAALEINPEYAPAYNARGNALRALSQLGKAVVDYEMAISLKPDSADYYNNLGVALADLERLNEALSCYEKAINLKPDFADAYNNFGVALTKLKQFDSAIESFKQALILKPDFAEAYFNMGNALRYIKRYHEALVNYNEAIRLKPNFADAYNNRGNVLSDLDRYKEALRSYERATSLKPDFADAYNNHGNALVYMKQYEAALASYAMAISIRKDFADAYNNRGQALKNLNRLEESLTNYRKAISLKPDFSAAHNNYGNALKSFYRFEEAVASYDKAISLKPDLSDAYYNRGDALRHLGRLEDALSSYEKAYGLNAEYNWLAGVRIHTAMRLCFWAEFTIGQEKLKKDLEAGARVASPFAVLGLIDSPLIQRKCTEIYLDAVNKPVARKTFDSSHFRDGKIRVGYYSADFHDHATMHLMAELFEQHNKSDFEFYGFSFGPKKDDFMRKRAVAAFHSFYEVNENSDLEISELSRRLKIDIAVDLKGYTRDARLGIFAERSAPIQVNYLGYPGTMGTCYHDYIIADHTLIPAESQNFYSEKIVYLPNSYQVNDGKRQISNRMFSREELGLPKIGFVFCCFNNSWKILPEVFDMWMNLLKKVDGSVLWLLEDNPTAAQNLRKEAQERAVDPQRLIFARRMPISEHLARHRCADLFLDTHPYNAHTTASDSIFAGLPILTRVGESFAARVAASLLTAINVPELITKSAEDYEAKALELALNPDKLKAIKAKLAANRKTSPLYDAQRFARHMEAAYVEMMMRYKAGVSPSNIEVLAS